MPQTQDFMFSITPPKVFCACFVFIFLLKNYFVCMHVCASMLAWVQMSAQFRRGCWDVRHQMWVQRTKLRSCGGAAGAEPPLRPVFILTLISIHPWLVFYVPSFCTNFASNLSHFLTKNEVQEVLVQCLSTTWNVGGMCQVCMQCTYTCRQTLVHRK